MIGSKLVAVCAALLVVLAALAGAMTVATQTGSTVEVETSPTDPNDDEATHAVVFTPSTESQLLGATFNDIRINYSVDTPAADVSNVGQGTIERIGIDRAADGDDVGTRIDVAANVTEVSAASDGNDLQIKTNQQLNIQTGDEIVVVMKPVQNPQNGGGANVDVVVNTQSTADSATDSVIYEYNSAAVNFTDQSTTGSSVTVDQANLSEEGYVVVLNESGRNPSAVRGATFLQAGNHSDVQVDIAPPVESQTELHAQIHLDSNGDHLFNYSSSGGEVDEPFANRDGNVMANDAATVWYADRTQTPTPTESDEDDPDITNYEVSASGDEVTVSFDSDETLADIEVDVRGAEDGTLTEEDFDGNRFEGYEATYQASDDGEYTLELTTAEDSSGHDGADDGDYTDSATVEGSSSGDDTATPKPTDDATDDETPTDDETESPTDEDSMDDDTATDGESMDDGTESTSDDSTADDGTESPTDDDGAGFGGVVALSALLASALLFYRRR